MRDIGSLVGMLVRECLNQLMSRGTVQCGWHQSLGRSSELL